MEKTSCIAIFDVGKTNKKIFLFDEDYKIVLEESIVLPQTTDSDNFACEDAGALTEWIKDSFLRLTRLPDFAIRAVNFSAYGASFVLLDEHQDPFLPIFNYLKPYPPALLAEFYSKHGGAEQLAMETASPPLENLNSGLQLVRLKRVSPGEFSAIRHALHLPQYLSFILTRRPASDMTSIGCHTMLWNFLTDGYHDWVGEERLTSLLAPISGHDDVINLAPSGIKVGFGLHDSSSALIPYRRTFHSKFILISTGTWCISLNPFNSHPLTIEELRQDCLCCLAPDGTSVMASRLFTGHEHEMEVRRLNAYFRKDEHFYLSVNYDDGFRPSLQPQVVTERSSGFGLRSLADFTTYAHAYHQLIFDIVRAQARSVKLVMSSENEKQIFVDGGFGKNEIFMTMLAAAFPGVAVAASSVPQASAIGAALAIHRHWNTKPIPGKLIGLRHYSQNERER